ncbi:MAG: hypothetical protein ACR2LT_02195 [Pyrinomonadaceae bacterium]
MKNKLQIVFLMLTFAAIGTISASAQNMSGTVKTYNVKFASGKNQATMRGAASYAMSYVYKFKAKKGQTITVKADSKEKDLTFSLFAPQPKEDELAFGVKNWSETAPETGTYSITLVMNNEKARKVPYNLLIKIE